MLATLGLASCRLASESPGRATRAMSCPGFIVCKRPCRASRSSLLMRLRSTACGATCLDTTTPILTSLFFVIRAFKKRRPSFTPPPFPKTSLKSLVLRRRAVRGSILRCSRWLSACAPFVSFSAPCSSRLSCFSSSKNRGLSPFCAFSAGT